MAEKIDDWLEAQRINGGPHGFECIGIARMQQVWDAAQEGMREYSDQLRQQLAAKQAEVDALMLEYCPSEMSQEQLDNWAEHQQSRSFNDQVTDDDFLHMIDESNFAQERE